MENLEGYIEEEMCGRSGKQERIGRKVRKEMEVETEVEFGEVFLAVLMVGLG